MTKCVYCGMPLNTPHICTNAAIGITGPKIQEPFNQAAPMTKMREAFENRVLPDTATHFDIFEAGYAAAPQENASLQSEVERLAIRESRIDALRHSAEKERDDYRVALMDIWDRDCGECACADVAKAVISKYPRENVT